MDEKKEGRFVSENEKNEQIEFAEPPLEAFLFEEKNPDDERKQKRRKIVFRLSVGIIATVFLLSSFTAVSSVFNFQAMKFLKTSWQLSRQTEIKEYKQAVVTIEGNNIKGTGFNISHDGLIITNFHVIEDMNPIMVYFSDGRIFKAIRVQEYPEVDLAILDISGKNLPTLSLASDSSWSEGEQVYVIGNPLTFYQIVNQGEILGLKGVRTFDIPVLALTAPVFRGNSGSPVIRKNGKVIGVVFGTTVPRVKDDTPPDGLAIPVEEVRNRITNTFEEEVGER